LVSLRYVDGDNAYRRTLAAWYDELLSEAEWIERVPVAAGCESSRHLYQILVDRRDDVMMALNERGIYPGVHYRDNASYPMYADQPSCPRAASASARVISLPMHLQLNRTAIERVAEGLKSSIAV
jgi:dTDP-4-amino-4,6-dideoxygalactose transaminase